MVGGGVNTVTGSGAYGQDWDVSGDRTLIERSAALQNARLTGDQFSMTLGTCLFGGEYSASRSDRIHGTATCSLSLPGLATVSVIGSWEAARSSPP